MTAEVRALIMLNISGGGYDVVLHDESDKNADDVTQHGEFGIPARMAYLALFNLGGNANIVTVPSLDKADCLPVAAKIVADRLGADWSVLDSNPWDYSKPRSRWNPLTETWDIVSGSDVTHAWRLAHQSSANPLLGVSSDLQSKDGLNSQANLGARIMLQYPA